MAAGCVQGQLHTIARVPHLAGFRRRNEKWTLQSWRPLSGCLEIATAGRIFLTQFVPPQSGTRLGLAAASRLV